MHPTEPPQATQQSFSLEGQAAHAGGKIDSPFALLLHWEVLHAGKSSRHLSERSLHFPLKKKKINKSESNLLIKV